ncbi:hypothetical protein IAR55_004889 [Kwoniella newhampshirensis]|uniref:Dienelactone hydrolase domain-containing protein n=1 Tax=Kwoniella newhampshirensis TaxID=1651941 RepID=A0AAW0YIQ8_9TREE
MSFMPVSACCLKGSILPGTPRGVMEPADSSRQVTRYHATPSDGVVVNDKAAVVLYTDLFGLGIPNPKIMADVFADKLGMHVFVPDFILRPPDPSVLDNVQPSYPEKFQHRSVFSSISSWLGFIFFKAYQLVPIIMNAKGHITISEKAIHDLKAEGFTTFGAVGYCRGGAVVCHLLSPADKSPTLLSCGVIIHPSPERETWDRIDKPTVWHMADHDQLFGEDKLDELRKVAEAKMKEGLEFKCVVHEDTSHGFAARPALEHEPTKKAFEEANADAVAFFKKHLLDTAAQT